MLSQQILEQLQSHQTHITSPILVDEEKICDIYEYFFGVHVENISSLQEQGNMDFLFHDCSDKKNQKHAVWSLRESTAKLYQTAGETYLAVFHAIEILTEQAANGLLHIFEDVPRSVIICVTSRAPEKIIPTLRSRIIELEHTPLQRGDNPHQAALDQYVKEKNPTLLLQMTLAPSKEAKFDREDALWIITGLQDAIECGRLSSRHAHCVLETRATLESSNTIAKYLIDRLLIDIACD